MIFERPIPGQSLTTELKGAPYENPSEIVDPIDAAKYHLERMNTEESTEDLIYFMEEGLSIRTITQGIIRGGVFGGRHSIDVGLIIAPVIHEYIKDVAELGGIDYDEGLDDNKARAVINYNRDMTRAKAMLRELKIDAADAVDEPSPMEKPMEEPEVMEEPMVAEAKPMGLMSKMGV